MNEGWLWLSILKTQAWPSPMSTTPAFSPGPWITDGPVTGSLRRRARDDLHEQCPDHITEKPPSSTRLGSRPRRSRISAYSSGFSPYSAARSAVDFSAASAVMIEASVWRSGAGERTAEKVGAVGGAQLRFERPVGVRHQAQHIA